MKQSRKFILLGIIVLSFIIYWFSFDVFKPLEPTQAMGCEHTITAYSYFLTQLSLMPKYIQMILVPVNQNIDHDVLLKNSFWNLGVLSGLSFIIGLLFIVVFFFNKNRLLSFGIIWFFVAISIEASIIPIHDLFFEHRTYLPSIGIIIAVFSVVSKVFVKRHFQTLWILTFGLILLFTYMTYQRNKVWKDEISLWTDAVAKSPNKARPYANLGIAHVHQNNLNIAIEHLSKSIGISDKYSRVYFNRGFAYLELERFDLAIRDFDRAIAIFPEYVFAYYNKGLAYSKLGNPKLAVENYSRVVQLNPKFELVYYNRGLDYLMLDQLQNAISDLSKAISYQPDFVFAYLNRGVAYLNEGSYKKAISDLNQAVNLDPNSDVIYYNRALSYHCLDDYENALKDYNTTLLLNLNYTKAYFHRGNLYYALGELEKAAEDYQKALNLDPSFVEAKDKLRMVNQMKNSNK